MKRIIIETFLTTKNCIIAKDFEVFVGDNEGVNDARNKVLDKYKDTDTKVIFIGWCRK